MATHADGLAIGLLLAWLRVFYPELMKSKRLPACLCGAMIVLGIVLYAINQVLFNYTSLGLIFGAPPCGVSVWKRLPKLLDWHGFYIISRLSYGMYLNHFGLLEPTARPAVAFAPARRRAGVLDSVRRVHPDLRGYRVRDFPADRVAVPADTRALDGIEEEAGASDSASEAATA